MKKSLSESEVVKLFATMSAAVALSGCDGGGSSGSAPQASDPSIPVFSPAPVPTPSPAAPGISTTPQVATGLLTRANEPGLATTGANGIGLNETFVLPTAALTKGASYTVTVAGATNGTAFTKTFAFVPSL